MPTAPLIDLEHLIISESLLDETTPCSWDQPVCSEPAEWVRACPRCRYHRFRCQKHHAADLARNPHTEIMCNRRPNRPPCPHIATVADLNATYRPV